MPSFVRPQVEAPPYGVRLWIDHTRATIHHEPVRRGPRRAAGVMVAGRSVAPPVDEMTLWDIVEEHLDEAAFLYWMRKIQLQAPDHDLATIASGPEARLLAHLDAL